jgi:hypothetical protein
MKIDGRTIGNWVMIILIVATVVFGMATCFGAMEAEREEERAKAAELTEKYGVPIRPYQYTRCFNGWLMIQTGTHDWTYPRDALFEPIPCTDND